jgi:hypothetical protein
MTTKTATCPFCGRPLGKDGRTCGKAACQAKAAVWSRRVAGGRGAR